ncbi:YceI family protein [Flagellimonas sp. HMM57]|uniref:YceI family protein n=1 Tax=unclassified Flagellimonas TaxID=2644544 RepID=UPI0013D5EC40|nr:MULTISPECIES: YceI family protein [unclassified Flagellimonas]UII75792.1 YceI family protein [Flagellimonas sp. HMM57]
MKSLLFSLFFAVSLSISSLFGQTNKIVDAEISFEFVSKETKGTIAGFKSESVIDFDNLENSVLRGSVASETLDTNNGLRNWSLKSGKYFDVDDYPRIRFESKQVKSEGEKLIVIGNLTIKDITKSITITFNQSGNQLIGTTSLYSIDYGIKIKKNRADNLVKVKMVFDID